MKAVPGSFEPDMSYEKWLSLMKMDDSPEARTSYDINKLINRFTQQDVLLRELVFSMVRREIVLSDDLTTERAAELSLLIVQAFQLGAEIHGLMEKVNDFVYDEHAKGVDMDAVIQRILDSDNTD